MSIRTADHFCAICDRERKVVVGTPETPLDLGALGAAKASTIPRHKYGHLPTKKIDDFIQVTEPHWLRRGNLKESDSVCKRHLAILMRGVDRGCEGGCCSPLHRGARLCRAGSLKAIPPTWRRRFVKHPKIKDEDKELMMFCWECYKKHMNHMSKYGDPMGRTFGKQKGVQRSNSLADQDGSGTTILQAMKRYKSMEKLDLDNVPPSTTGKKEERRASSSSSSPRYNGNLSNNSKTPDAEIRSTPSRRMNRGRRSHKSKRSPSPPNNISPVRTSVVHSKRKHSPHKSSKSPSAWRAEITATTIIEAQCSPPALSPRNATRLSIDEGALADTESPRGPPIPPPGLFSLRMEPSDDVFDVFRTRTTRATFGSEARTLEGAAAPPNTPQVKDGGVFPQRDMIPEVPGQPILPRASPDTCTAVSQNGIHADNGDFQVPRTESRLQEELETAMQAEESTTSADEMAAIFANQNLHDSDTLSDYVDETNKYPEQATGDMQTAEIVEFSDLSELSENIVASHQHESSESSSDKTGDTQIERNNYKTPEKVTIDRESPHDSESQEIVKVDEVEMPQKANEIPTTSDNQRPQNLNDMLGEEPAEDANQEQKPAISTSDFTNCVFVSPTRNNQEESAPASASIVNYSLSPQSFRRLESMRLQFEEESFSTEDDERRKLYFDDDARNRSHPMRNHVLLKVPREQNGALMHSYIRLPAEDVEIFPDALSFLDGITQTVGEDMTMYAQDGVWMAKVDLNHEENRKAHRTSQFSDDILVVRRGQPFEIFLELSEKYDEEKHKIMAELMIGESPRVSNGTHLFLPIQHNGTTLTSTTYNLNAGGQWSGRFIDTLDKRLKISLTPPSTCSIGSYKLYFQVERDGVRSRWQCSPENDRKVIVVFNPWNIDDAVFMSSQADRQEYVVSDAGCIYSGNKANIIRVPWIFGQYEPGVLQACVTLVESSGIPCTKLGDPVAVAKVICRTLTASLPPNTYIRNRGRNLTSGAEILQRFLDTGVLFAPSDNKALSGLLVTALRCVGLPSRPVTCLNCALETDLPMNVNVHYSQQGNLLDYMNRDKVWPSYAWAGVWMSRLDLPPGFGGWQALLPPTSNRECVGPLPAYGIKKGQTSCEGTQEHFVSLNADKKSWIVWQDGNMTLAATDRGFAGAALMTKSVGSLEPQDVTKLYKFNEGCEEHKLAVHTARMHNGSQNIYEKPREPEPFLISLTTNPEIINLGNDATVMVTIKNNTNSERHLTVHLDAAILAEDGTTVVKVQRETVLAEVSANKSVEIPVKLKLAPCLHKLTQYHHLSMTAFGSIRDMESQHVIATHLAGIKYPDIELQLRGEFKVGGEVTVLSRMRNPLPYALTNTKISLNTSGLIPLESITSNSGKSVGPWQVYKCERVYRCQRAGKHTVTASLSSDHLNGPTGMQEIDIL